MDGDYGRAVSADDHSRREAPNAEMSGPPQPESAMDALFEAVELESRSQKANAAAGSGYSRWGHDPSYGTRHPPYQARPEYDYDSRYGNPQGYPQRYSPDPYAHKPYDAAPHAVAYSHGGGSEYYGQSGGRHRSDSYDHSGYAEAGEYGDQRWPQPTSEYPGYPQARPGHYGPSSGYAGSGAAPDYPERTQSPAGAGSYAAAGRADHAGNRRVTPPYAGETAAQPYAHPAAGSYAYSHEHPAPHMDTPADRSFAAPEGDASHVPARTLAAKESSVVLVGGRDSPQAPAHAPSAETAAAAEDHPAENGAAPKDAVNMDTDQQGGEQPAAAAEETSASPAATEKDTEMGEEAAEPAPAPAATNGDEAVEETAVTAEAPGEPAQAQTEAQAEAEAALRGETPASNEAARAEEPDLSQTNDDEGKASATAEAEHAPVPAAEAGAGADRPVSRKGSANNMLGDAADGLDLSDESPTGTPGAAEAHGEKQASKPASPEPARDKEPSPPSAEEAPHAAETEPEAQTLGTAPAPVVETKDHVAADDKPQEPAADMDTDIPDDAPTPPADLAAGMEDTADAAATGREPAPAPAPQPEPEKTTVAAAEPQAAEETTFSSAIIAPKGFTGWTVPDLPVYQKLVISGSRPIGAGSKLLVTNCLFYIQHVLLSAMMKHKDAWPFNQPVDPVALGIPDYPKIIKKPMDYGTIHTRLDRREYRTAEDCLNDILQVSRNAKMFNPPGTDVVQMVENVEKVFVKKLEKFPTEEALLPVEEEQKMLQDINRRKNREKQRRSGVFSGPSRPKNKKKAKSPAPPRAPKAPRAAGKQAAYDTDSDMSAPATLKRAYSDSVSSTPEPKRKKSEKSSSKAAAKAKAKPAAPSPAPASKASGKGKKGKAKLGRRLQFCSMLLDEMLGERHAAYAWIFYVPVDPVALSLPDYFDVIKKPMDLGTIRRKMDAGEYLYPHQFAEDVRQMFTNCYRYNHSNDEVSNMGRKLQEFFEVQYAQLPDDDVGDSPIAYNFHSADVVEKKASKKAAPKKAPAPSKASAKRAAPPPKAAPRQPPAASKPAASAEEFTYEMKQKLSEDINNLSGDKIAGVVEIIKNSVDVSKEDDVVEVDIDKLSNNTLAALRKYVDDILKPKAKAAPAPKPAAQKRKPKALQLSDSSSESGSSSSSSDSDSSDDSDSS